MNHTSTTHPGAAALDELQTAIHDARPVDQKGLRRRLASMRKAQRSGKPFDRNLARFQRDLEQSRRTLARRRANVPQIDFPEDLPITAKRDEIIDALGRYPVIVVCGETGSGKSTQLPKLCLAAGRGIGRMIGHTQPRRIAARSVASRVAEELHTPLGEHVGFKIRFTDLVRPESYIKFMTDGILLAETQGDRSLEQYDTIIIDEAHERSLNIDFLLGYLKRLLARRDDLRVIITSATIDAQRFARHFGTEEHPAPVIEVSGRTYPVEIRYRPPRGDGNDEIDICKEIADTADRLAREDTGDMLVFLPTERDIRDVARVLRGRSIGGSPIGRTQVLPLYARLSAGEQNKIFQQTAERRIVLATNVAESSITVPRVRFVIDTGTARLSRFAPRSKVQRLPIEPIAQAAADQRAGRCGRSGPGICVRLYSEDDYLSRDRYTTPEIRRTNLAGVILQMLALRLGEIGEFPFLDRPRRDAVQAAYRTLFELGAVDEQHQLTEMGSSLSRLPVDPRIGRMILAAADHGCLSEMLIIASALEVQDPRERPADRSEAADRVHARFGDERSDFLSYLKLWDYFHHLRQERSRSQFEKACRKEYLSHRRFREWQEVHRQLLMLVRQQGLKPAARKDNYKAIHKSLLAGLLSAVATRRGNHEYQGADGDRFYLWPGSGAFERKPKWVVAAERVETSQRYLRMLAQVQPEWIEPLAGHLVERSYQSPHWSAKQGRVVALERVSLFDLNLSRHRNVNYGRLAPAISRDLFIRHGLVDAQLPRRFAFLEHNQQLLESIAAEAARTRDRRYLVDSATLTDFYDRRLPADVYDVASLRKWLGPAQGDRSRVLMMDRVDLLPVEQEADSAAAHAFPQELELDGQRLQLDYRFSVGTDDDGVTLSVPRELLSRLDDDQLGWLVPGLLEEKIVALIRQLPKPLRQKLVPAPDTARDVAGQLRFGHGAFIDSVTQVLGDLAGEPIEKELFQPEELPQHLRMNVRVVDEQGECVAQGRSLTAVRDALDLALHDHDAREIADPHWHRDGMTAWQCGALPEQIELGRGSFTLTGYPALVDQGDTVGLRLFASEMLAEQEHRRGVQRLLMIGAARELRAQLAWFPGLVELEEQASPLMDTQQLQHQLMRLIATRALSLEEASPRDEQAYRRAYEEAMQRIPLAVQDAVTTVRPLFASFAQCWQVLREQHSALPDEVAADIESQLAELMRPGFLADTSWRWLQEYPRFLQAIERRLQKRRGASLRDAQQQQRIEPFVDQYRRRRDQHLRREITDIELEHFGWMLEEYRVSLFAQELGTSLKVSPERLERQWEQVTP